MRNLTTMGIVLATALALAGCGDDGSEADRLGIGAQCSVPDDCEEELDQT